MGCCRFIPREKGSTTKSHNEQSVLHLDMRRRGQEIGKRQRRWRGKGPDSRVQNSVTRRRMARNWLKGTRLQGQRRIVVGEIMATAKASQMQSRTTWSGRPRRVSTTSISRRAMEWYSRRSDEEDERRLGWRREAIASRCWASAPGGQRQSDGVLSGGHCSCATPPTSFIWCSLVSPCSGGAPGLLEGSRSLLRGAPRGNYSSHQAP